MNLQDAYHKGLNDAESLAILKLTNALNGVDDTPFHNPDMEIIRQRLMTFGGSDIYKILESMINGEDFEYDEEGTNAIILEFYKDLMVYLLGMVGQRNKLGVRMKDSINKAKFDLTLERNKVN